MLAVHTLHDGPGAHWLAIPGWGFDHRCWQPLADALTERRAPLRLQAVDLPGTGASAPSGHTEVAAWYRWLIDQLQALLSPDTRVLGWSLGAQLALALPAVKHLLLAGNPCFVQRPDWPAAMAPAVYRQFCSAFEQNPGATLRRFAGLVAGATGLARVQMEAQLAAYDAAATDDWRLGLAALNALDQRAVLPALKCAEWWLAEGDALVPAALATQLPAAVRVRELNRAGHALPLTHAHLLAQALCHES